MQETETAQFVTGTNESDMENESDSDNDIVMEIKQDRACSTSKITLIFMSIIILLAVTIVTVLSLYTSKTDTVTNINDDNLVINYVLPNDTVIVSTSTDTLISGQFRADAVGYDFESVSSDTTQHIEFINSDHTLRDWYGFRISYANNTSLLIELMNVVNGSNMVVMGKNESLTAGGIMLFDVFWGSKIGTHYIELSMKLGVAGYSGDISHPIEQLHRFAIWIWSFVDAEQLNQQFDIQEEQEKLDAIYTASERAGYRIQTMDELNRYTSDLELDNSEHGRSLLQEVGNCGEPFDLCGNPCFGKCGLRCGCISRLCGNCGCWWGCYHHDFYCSCVGMSDSCCINVFWIRCDGSGICN